MTTLSLLTAYTLTAHHYSALCATQQEQQRIHENCTWSVCSSLQIWEVCFGWDFAWYKQEKKLKLQTYSECFVKRESVVSAITQASFFIDKHRTNDTDWHGSNNLLLKTNNLSQINPVLNQQKGPRYWTHLKDDLWENTGIIEYNKNEMLKQNSCQHVAILLSAHVLKCRLRRKKTRGFTETFLWPHCIY